MRVSVPLVAVNLVIVYEPSSLRSHNCLGVAQKNCMMVAALQSDQLENVSNEKTVNDCKSA